MRVVCVAVVDKNSLWKLTVPTEAHQPAWQGMMRFTEY
jgi:hypothetical protein